MSTTQSDHDMPPPFSGSHNIELTTIQHGTISHVNLYSRRAEVTRIFRFPVQVGLNHVMISGLPTVMDSSSLRVEGRGSATIQDVTLGPTPLTSSTHPTSSALKALLLKQNRLQSSLSHAQKSLSSLEKYLNALTPEYTEPSSIHDFLKTYEATATELDEKIQLTNKHWKKHNTNNDIDKSKLNMRAKLESLPMLRVELKLRLHTATVTNASWNAAYDIRVNLNTKDKPIELFYKASIIQSTGEPWSNVSLSLETASPSFGVGIPTLYPWNLSVYNPAARATTFGNLTALEDDAPNMEHRVMNIGGNENNTTAIFEVPGLITIPSDNAAHSVTVAKLELDANITWVCVPRRDTKVHLKANIQNVSEFPLLPGVANVYLDGSFISRSRVPQVSPQECFECPLGVDPTIRTAYHPLVKKRETQSSMFSSKAGSHLFSQRITIYNAKQHAIADLKIIDHIPVSQDQNITVKLLKPPLPQPEIGTEGKSNVSSMRECIKIADGILAQWDGADDPEADVESLGKDGKLNWNCEIVSQGKTNLLLSWEVTAPLKTEIAGLP
ncbi:hypothetical protein BDQ17DRAFT_1427976 [Cyathus striatus]|nr:hypothetical protein BDQ17DRAFT_1427976 [Cyathus striatus]